MFFKREKERVLVFSEQLDQLKSAGYAVQPAAQGRTCVAKGNLAALIEETASGPAIADAGLLLGAEVAVLTDLGFQKVFLAPGGKRTPALAEHLQALHDFKEDLGEALGITSLYNEGLGTTNEKHLYDRVQNRDAGVAPRPWDRS